MATKPKGKGKVTPKGVSAKLNKEAGIGPVKLPLWGWGAVAVGALWFYFHFIRGSDTGTDQGSGIASGSAAPGGGGGAVGRGSRRHHKHRNRHDRTPIRRCPPGYHRVGHRCVRNVSRKQGSTPRRQLMSEHTATTRRRSSGTLDGRLATNHHRPRVRR